MPRFRQLAAAAFASAIMIPAFAQAPAVAPAAPPPSVPTPACSKPDFPGKLAPETSIRRWTNEFKTYTDCLKAYIGDRNAVIDANAKAAKVAVEQFNASVTEYNDTIQGLK